MIVALTGGEKAENRDLFEQDRRARCGLFARGTGWIAEDEGDPYDHDDAVYFFDIDRDRRLRASSRITPTVKGSLIADRFAHLVENGRPPRAPTIYERTRSVALPPRWNADEPRRARRRMTAAMLEWCLAHGLTQLQAVIDYRALPSYLAISLLTTPLGLPQPYGAGRCMAVRWPICPQLLEDVRNCAAPGGRLH